MKYEIRLFTKSYFQQLNDKGTCYTSLLCLTWEILYELTLPVKSFQDKSISKAARKMEEDTAKT